MSALIHVMESVFTRGNVLYLLQGLFTTLFVAVISICLSIIFRNSIRSAPNLRKPHVSRGVVYLH